ncbi:probable protein phosphatase 2C 62 isoform X2 [Ricinus communis]|uniref:Protein phosphatase 2c, putative n=1 Tax=Ricinus communis TaxID=3988 RepID=B9T5J5_RICCO|nr:probable protein phosphatase 2C 62 isoform X2 [Ricinus communis]EEF28870.1 protein phosphatase 2c, putative [Ricinus communis]|eukprot:XP_002533514.1 probable protein phosphatase 2C 62 isoform X2 [Ricinus communis]
MADARSLTFCSCVHPPKPILLPSLPISFSSSKRTSCFSFKTVSTPKTTTSSSSSSSSLCSSRDSVSGDVDIISTTEHSDGSLLFQFGELNEISENVKIGESKVTLKDAELENADEEVNNLSKEEATSYSEFVDGVKEIGLCGEGSSDNANGSGETLSADAVSDVQSSDETHIPEMIYFKILTPVNISELEYVVKDETSGNSNTTSISVSGLDMVSSQELSQEESEGEIVSDMVEPDVKVHSSFASQADTTTKDPTVQHTEENYKIDYGGDGEIHEAVPISSSWEASVILDNELTHIAVDEETVEEPTHNAVDEKPTENAAVEEPAHTLEDEEPAHTLEDEEPVEQPTENVADEEPTHTVEDEEPVEQPTANAMNDEPSHTAMDEKPTPSIMDEELTQNEVDEEPVEQSTHNAGAEEPVHDALEEEPTLNASHEEPTLNAVVEEPTHNAVEEELTHNVVDEEPTNNLVDEEPTHVIVEAESVKNEEVEDLKMLAPSSHLVEETAEAEAENSSDGDVSNPHAAETRTIEATETQEEISMSRFYLYSGSASVAHPSKALTGGEDAYFVDQNWLSIADGAGQWSFEGITAGLYAQELIKNLGKIVADSKSNLMTDPVEVLDKAAMETQSSGSSTALVAYFDGQALHVANIGDSGVLIIRNGTIFKKSSPMKHEFNFPLQIKKGDNLSELIEVYAINLDEGDVVVTASNGLFDNLYEQEIALIISNSLQASLKPQEIAELLARRAQEVGQSTAVRCPFADAAQAAGYVGYTGGKLDDVTVIVSLLHKSSASQMQ